MIVLIADHLSNSAEMLKFRGKGQIPLVGSKFRSPRKTVGPNNSINTKSMFMVFSSCLNIARVQPVYVMNAATVTGGHQPLDQADRLEHKPACRLSVNYTHHRHFIITQPKSWYSFYHPTEGRRLSRPRWLATYPDGLPGRRRSSVQILVTGLDVK